jgi:uncharacterized protein (DUF427 family)
MTLTIGSAPFGTRPSGMFNFSYDAPKHVLYFEDSPRRVRAMLGERVVADSRRAKLMHETGHLPVYYFPREDVDQALLEPTDHSTRCPFKGDALWWSIRDGDRVVENAAWSYPEPLKGAPPLAGYLALEWRAVDRWLEEDEEIEGHPRDPYTRVDIRRSSRHVTVSLDGQTLAETRSPKLLFETSLPPRIYVPSEDIRGESLAPSATRTYCPYKGRASYWSADVGGRLVDDVAWSYPEPFPEAEKVRDHLSFLHEELLVEVDGEPHEHQPHRR